MSGVMRRKGDVAFSSRETVRPAWRATIRATGQSNFFEHLGRPVPPSSTVWTAQRATSGRWRNPRRRSTWVSNPPTAWTPRNPPASIHESRPAVRHRLTSSRSFHLAQAASRSRSPRLFYTRRSSRSVRSRTSTSQWTIRRRNTGGLASSPLRKRACTLLLQPYNSVSSILQPFGSQTFASTASPPRPDRPIASPTRAAR